MFRKFHRLVFIAGVTGLIVLAVWPFHDWVLRYGLFLSLAAAWTAGLGYIWQRKIWRVVVMALPLLAAVPFLLPGKPLHPAKQRDRYIAAMRGVEGASYVWGGESHWAIDCSGLPRRALRDALWVEGCENANGAAFREWARQWWFDTSAKALGENYRGFTRPTGAGGKLRDLDFTTLVRGDLAVTADGRHVMVYLGNGDWIQADPGPVKVTISSPATDPNYYFNAMVKMQRWTVLERVEAC
ncbi:MAG: NlpC/P60 family protein [Luteolibacter sp.]|uniref:NlpC/P60 family protein n=1 Tax=Luteolibacter sp. TaxID=1962973 RepID=UPI003263F907